jgi:hypothetical protein
VKARSPTAKAAPGAWQKHDRTPLSQGIPVSIRVAKPVLAVLDQRARQVGVTRHRYNRMVLMVACGQAIAPAGLLGSSAKKQPRRMVKTSLREGQLSVITVRLPPQAATALAVRAARAGMTRHRLAAWILTLAAGFTELEKVLKETRERLGLKTLARRAS